MKKLLKVFACFGLALSVSACSGGKVEDKALDQLNLSIKKLSELSSYDFSSSVDVMIEGMSAKIHGSYLTEGGIQLATKVELESTDAPSETFAEIYIKDNMAYSSILGQKNKSEIDLSILDNLPIDVDKNFTIKKEDMKKYLTSATYIGDTLHLAFDSEALNESALPASGMEDNEIKELTIDIILENDFMKTATITTVLAIKDKEQKMVISLALDNINAVESIEFPSDLDSYTLATEQPALGDL